jgi:hypothetical protein
MSEQPITIYTSVKPELLRKKLLIGTFLAGTGVILLAICGAYLSPDEMQVWGLPILAIGLGLIAWGMIPFRRLSYLEANPNQLTLTDGEYLQYNCRGVQQFTIPMRTIEKTDFIDSKGNYGIAIWLKSPAPEPVVVHNRRLNMTEEQKHNRKNYGCDLFLPYFTRRKYTQIFQDI